MAAHRRSVGTTKAAALLLLHDDPGIKLNINRALNIAESIGMIVVIVWKSLVSGEWWWVVRVSCQQNFSFSLFLLSLWLSPCCLCWFNQLLSTVKKRLLLVLDQLIDLCLAYYYGSTAKSILVAARKPREMSSIRICAWAVRDWRVSVWLLGNSK